MLSFTNAVGNLFARLGKLGLLVKQARSYQASQKTNMIDTTSGVVAQLNGEPDIQAQMGSGYIAALNSPGDAVGSLAQQMAASIVSRQVYRDNPLSGQNLTSVTAPQAVNEIIRQMKLAGATVLNMTITSSVTSFTGKGNGVIVVSVNRPLDGLVLENAFGEKLTIVCTNDSYIGGAAAGNEPLSIFGQGAQPDYFAFDWPLGSGAGGTLSAIDGNSSNTAGNLLTNSNFSAYTVTANNPDSWVIVTGLAGTHVFQETGLIYDGTGCMKWTGDAAGTLIQVDQTFNSSSGTAGALLPLSQYSFNIFLRRASATVTGILTVDLDDTNGTVILDANNVANSFTIDLSTLTTAYGALNVAFRTPAFMPASQRLRLRLTTALPNGVSFYLAKASFGPMSQLYASGPFFNVHAGSVPFLTGDYAYATITNSRGAGGTLSTWQSLMSVLMPFGIPNEIIYPSSSSPTVLDAWIA